VNGVEKGDVGFVELKGVTRKPPWSCTPMPSSWTMVPAVSPVEVNAVPGRAADQMETAERAVPVVV